MTVLKECFQVLIFAVVVSVVLGYLNKLLELIDTVTAGNTHALGRLEVHFYVN